MKIFCSKIIFFIQIGGQIGFFIIRIIIRQVTVDRARSADMFLLQEKLATLDLKVIQASNIGKVVRDVQEQHFNAIQKFQQDINELQNDMIRCELKLTTLQADFLNSTLLTVQESNKDLQQDLQLENLDGGLKLLEAERRHVKSEMKELTGIAMERFHFIVGDANIRATEAERMKSLQSILIG